MICEYCHTDFTPKKNTHNVKFCSSECRNKTYTAYRSNWQRKRKEEQARKPAPNKIECLICHGHYRKVGSHVFQVHGITGREYRETFGLDVKRGLLTEIEREPLREHVFSNGTVNNLKKGAPFRFVKNDPKAGKYTRSEQTLKRLGKKV